MEKIRYEFDPHNKLTASGSALRGVRKVLDGQFKIAGHNTLTYHIKAPLPAGIKAPHQLKLRGNWSLTEGHQLRLTLDKWHRQTFGESLTLQGEILDVQKNSLLFALTTKTKEDMPSKYTLELAGAWQADEQNRITFRVNKEASRFDSLIFEGAWEINQKNQIIYSYKKEQIVRKSKEVRTLIFKGYWDIRDKARLTYVIDRNSDSGFDFNTGIGIFKNNYIKYEVGIILAQKKEPLKRTITLFGKWKVKKNIGLVFEVEQGGGRAQEIVFGIEARLTDKGTAAFNLRGRFNKEIGAELELSQDIFEGEGQAFLRLLKGRREEAILAGAGWRW